MRYKGWGLTILVIGLVILFSGLVQAQEVKVYNALQLQQCANGTVAASRCVVMNSIALGAPLVVSVPIEIISQNGAAATSLTGPNPVIQIRANGVTIGGPGGAGFTISGAGDGIHIGAPTTRDVTIQSSRIVNNNLGNGVFIDAPSAQNFRFLDDEISNNGGYGIYSLPPTSYVSEMVISNVTFRGDGAGNIFFNNSGEVSRLSVTGSSFSASQGGIGFGTNVTDVRDSDISNCTIQGHSIVGILFGNSGRVYGLTISGNSIISNQYNIAFANGSLVSDLLIEGNRIESASNGNGIGFINGGDIESVDIQNNTIERNALNGILVNNTGEFTDSTLSGNTLRNNGVNGLFVNHTVATDFTVDGLSFSNNVFSQNGSSGLRIITDMTDIATISFSGDQFTKNTALGLCLGTNNQGGIAEISFDNVQANENQGGAGNGCPAGAANGSGVELVATNGGINGVSFSSSVFRNNGGLGARVAALGNGDVRGVSATNTSFIQNGTRAPVGQGSGLLASGRTVQSLSLDNVQATSNNDHGFQATATNDIQGVQVQGGEYSDNDSNVDGVGDGINISAAGNVFDLSITGSRASNNSSGIQVSIQDRIGRGITIQNSPEINNNRNNGVIISSVRDLTDVIISGNALIGSGFGISVNATGSGANIMIQNNTVKGRSGTGIFLNSTGVTISGCDIRNNDIGVDVRKATNNYINRNNIVNNSQYGVSAGLAGGVVDAENNWWGEPSGPGGVGPGIGDAVTANVDYDPWLREPAVATGANFQITAFDVAPPAPDVGEAVTISVTVENTGTDEGTQEIIVQIKSGTTVLHEERRTTPLSAAGSTMITVSYTFDAAGSYTVEAATDNDTETRTITVGGGGPTPPPPSGGVVCQYAGGDKIVDGADLIGAIQAYARGEINGADLIQVIQYYATGTPCDRSLSGASTAACAVSFALESVGFSNSQFVVEGAGIAAIDVRVYDLAGRTVFSGSAGGNTLAFAGMNGNGEALANGIYLYSVKAYGLNGGVARSVQKLAFLR